MLELLTAGAKMPSDEPLFLFDAEMQEEGDEVMIDQITGNALSRYLASYAGQPGYNNKIVTHADYGKVMLLAGNCYHSTADWFKPPDTVPAGKKLVYQFEFQSNTTGTYFGTGGSFNGGVWRVGFSLLKSSSTHNVTLIYNPSGSSGTSTTVPSDNALQDIRVEFTNQGEFIQVRREGKSGISGPYGFKHNLFTSLFVFGTPRDMAGLGSTKTIYGSVKRIKVSLEKI